MSVGGVSTNAAISAFLAGERAASHAAAAALRAEPVAPSSLARKVSDQDNTAQKQRPVESQSRDASGGQIKARDRRTTQDRPVDAREPYPTEPSTLFLVQLLGQEGRVDSRPGLPMIDPVLKGHRDGASLGSEQYRLYGGEPSLLTEGPKFLRIAV